MATNSSQGKKKSLLDKIVKQEAKTEKRDDNKNGAEDGSVFDSWADKQFVSADQIFEKALRLSRTKKISEEEIEIKKMLEKYGIKKWEDKKIGW